MYRSLLVPYQMLDISGTLDIKEGLIDAPAPPPSPPLVFVYTVYSTTFTSNSHNKERDSALTPGVSLSSPFPLRILRLCAVSVLKRPHRAAEDPPAGDPERTEDRTRVHSLTPAMTVRPRPIARPILIFQLESRFQETLSGRT